MPNTFWPNTKQPPAYPNGMGNSIQQNTAANNPDVFCQSQGSGYRLPSVGEFNSGARNFNPGGELQSQLPAHWSNYQNNDITKTRLPIDNTRSANGAIYNEWGDLSKYSKGWTAENYWASEVSVTGFTYYRTNEIGGWGRYTFLASTGNINPPPAKSGGSGEGFTRLTNITSNYNVACVRDLVPTPSTPNPSKT